MLTGCSSAQRSASQDQEATEGSEGAGPVETSAAAADADKCETLSPIYPTKGVHSPCDCGPDECVEKRKPSEPPDPRYPEYWVSRWNMFRVFRGYERNLPPYADPPTGLEAGVDYEKTHGATYYDSTYRPQDGDGHGAMMEHYEKYCLPIFPIDSHFTCSFISLGNKAYFLTYEGDRPKEMPPCCLFSPYNHPPRRDFIKHLPYSAQDSTHLDNTLQAYRYIAKGPGDQDIWFAYAFYRGQWLDPDHRFLRPQSFYFSGSPTKPPDAPFVSQNYVDFRIERPDPAKTWALVGQMCPPQPPACQLFDPPVPPKGAQDEAQDEAQGEAQQGQQGRQTRGSGWNDVDFAREGTP